MRTKNKERKRNEHNANVDRCRKLCVLKNCLCILYLKKRKKKQWKNVLIIIIIIFPKFSVYTMSIVYYLCNPFTKLKRRKPTITAMHAVCVMCAAHAYTHNDDNVFLCVVTNVWNFMQAKSHAMSVFFASRTVCVCVCVCVCMVMLSWMFGWRVK